MKIRKTVVIASAFACVIACSGDFLSLFILGPKYPGYSQLSDTMSSLGSSASPVSDIISNIWIIMGGLIIIFAFGLRAANSTDDKYVKIAFWLLIIYGVGEGIGSGLFKADSFHNSYTTSFIIHDILGSAGVFAILILPPVVQRIESFAGNRCFIVFSKIVLILGTLFLVLFSFRFLGFRNVIIDEIAKYKGLWQRLFVLVYYLYMTTIAVKILGKALK